LTNVRRNISNAGMSARAAVAPGGSLGGSLGAPGRARPAPRGRAGPRGAGPAAPAAGAEATAAGLLLVFVVALFLPLKVDVAGLTLTPVRIFLLAGFVPLLLRLLRGAAGPITPGDVLLGLHGLWLGVAIVAVHGSERLAFAGIAVVESFGGYLAGRVLIRSVADYRRFFRYFLTGLALVAPFVLLENLTGRLYFSRLLEPLGGTLPKVQAGAEAMRMGFYRAQAVVDHPILWGVFCSIAIANAYFLYRDDRARRLVLTGFATLMTFTSLSSGPLLAAVLQLGMIGWGWITRHAWWLLVGLVVFAYVAIDLLSNRTPVQVMISYLTFNPATGYWRLHIWTYGTAEVMRHPLFGIGLNDWTRPAWLASDSVDNFWLLTAMRFGLPGVLLLLGGIAANLVRILRQELPEELRPVRTGYVVALIGTLLALMTVHIWGATATLVLFYYGAGCWLFTAAKPAAVPARRPAGGDSGDPDGDPGGAPAEASEPRRGPTKEERLARRRAQYSRQRP
jgi:hypothetical protein